MDNDVIIRTALSKDLRKCNDKKNCERWRGASGDGAAVAEVLMHISFHYFGKISKVHRKVYLIIMGTIFERSWIKQCCWNGTLWDLQMILISIASRQISRMWSTWSWQTQTSPTPGNMEQAIFRGSATDYLGNIWGYNLSTLGESQLKRWQDIEQTTEVEGGPLIQYDLGQARLQRVSPQRLLDTVVVVAWLRFSLRFRFCLPVLRPLHPAAGHRHHVAALQACHWAPGHCVSRIGLIGGRKKVIEQDLGHLTNCQTLNSKHILKTGKWPFPFAVLGEGRKSICGSTLELVKLLFQHRDRSGQVGCQVGLRWKQLNWGCMSSGNS